MAFIRLKRVAERLTVSEATVRRMVKQGGFPAPVQLSPGRVAWSEAAVDDWLRSKTGIAA